MPSPGAGPESSAERVALWRAIHALVDAPPHIIEDDIGLRLVDPPDTWRQRPDMDVEGTRLFRASIVARARFIEDLVTDEITRGVTQYVILGAGLDTFAQRRPEFASRMTLFEVDKPAPQEWKRKRLNELGFGVPGWLRLVPVDFEAGQSWRAALIADGFDAAHPAVVASTGVSMYLTHAANLATLREVAALRQGSTLVMSFLLPLELAAPELQPGFGRSTEGARSSGTPFLSFYTAAEMLSLARDSGFQQAEHVSAPALNERYFAGRTDGLHTVAGEELLVATT